MDINMPTMDGLEATKQIQELKLSNKINPHLKVVMVSAFLTQEDKSLAMKYGAADYINKPVGLSAILAVLNKHFYGSSG